MITVECQLTHITTIRLSSDLPTPQAVDLERSVVPCECVSRVSLDIYRRLTKVATGEFKVQRRSFESRNTRKQIHKQSS